MRLVVCPVGAAPSTGIVVNQPVKTLRHAVAEPVEATCPVEPPYTVSLRPPLHGSLKKKFCENRLTRLYAGGMVSDMNFGPHPTPTGFTGTPRLPTPRCPDPPRRYCGKTTSPPPPPPV
ncbi:MAG: hypothetical protein LBS86_07740 [Treponema sp.]|nr:hypothetical protein [Treponema sp.]